MTLMFSHPGRSKLREWLTSSTPSPNVTDHVEGCERCASRLEDLAADATDGAAAATDNALLARAVKDAWAPPSDLTARVMQEISERERNERDLDVIVDLLGIASEAAGLMLRSTDDPPHEHGSPST